MSTPIQGGRALLRARVFGFPVHLDLSFVIIMAALGWYPGVRAQFMVLWIVITPFAVLVHEMNHHVIWLPVDFLFARVVEMKLAKLIALSAGQYHAAPGIINLDGVAVVDDLERRRSVIEFDRRQRLLSGIANVDGRLPSPELAGSVVSFQVAPVRWALRTLVRPVVRAGLCLSRCGLNRCAANR